MPYVCQSGNMVCLERETARLIRRLITTKVTITRRIYECGDDELSVESLAQ